MWVNVAMATVFSPVSKLTASEVERGTAVTYLGQVYGMMAALRRMRPRNRGAIVNVGSALAYRSVPLNPFIAALSSPFAASPMRYDPEILHDKLKITLSMVDLPAVNTPNSIGRSIRPDGERGRFRRYFSQKYRLGQFISPLSIPGGKLGLDFRL